MKKAFTVCARDCYDTCFAVAETDDTGRVVSLRGESENPITRGFTCPRGNKDAERLYSNRVLTPHWRSGPKPGRDFEKRSRAETLDLVSRRLGDVIEKSGPEKVLLLDYSGNMGLLASVFPKRLWNAVGATRTDYTICAQSGRAGLSLHYGLGYGIQPEEFSNRRLTVYWGFNPVVSAPHIWALTLKARRELNGQVVVVDPRRSDTASQADLWIRPKPGSDVALAYGIARYLIANNLADLDFIGAWTRGFEAYEGEAVTWTPERVEETTGVDWASVEEFGAAYAAMTPNAMAIGIGFQKSVQGAEAVRATSLLPALLGQHRGYFYTNAPGYLVDHGYLTGKPFMTGSPRVVSQVALGDSVARGDYKFVYVFGMNPALTLPNQKAFREGLLREDIFVVVHETHWTETCDFADVVLPAQTYLEKDDIVMPWAHWYARKSQRVVEPLGESMHEVDLMVEISKRLGLKEAWLYEDPWKAIEKSLEGALETGSFNDLLEGRTVKLKYRRRDEYQTSSRKIEFSSRLAAEKGYHALPMQIPLEREEGAYLLLNSSDRKYTHTQFQEVYGPIPAVVKMNTEDARRLGTQDDEIVTLFNDLGETAARVKVSDSVPVGVLWSPKQFPGLEGEPQNILTQGRPQQIGGGSVYNSTTVRVKIGKQMKADVP